MILTAEHINYIIRDIHYCGIVDEDLAEELVDHICTLVEEKMVAGKRFIEAYEEVRSVFGSNNELQQTQTLAIHSSNYNTKIMIKNYFKIALRNLVKHKFYSVINITGLAVSMACCLLISLFVIDELSYDTFFKDSECIYRSNRHGKYGDNEFHFATAPAPFGKALINEIPEIDYAVRFRNHGSYLVKTTEMTESFKESSLIFADVGFFNLFGVELIKGNPDEALTDPATIAISQSMADKYFAGEEAVGKILILDGGQEYHVTAVYRDIPDNSHLNFDFLMSMETLESSRSSMWTSNNFFTYFKVREGTDTEVLEKKINKMADAHVGSQIEELTGNTMEEFKAAGNYMYFNLQPLSDVYLHSNFRFDIGKTGDVTYVYIFIIIAAFILVIACINFMNLSTARSSNRAKEVGVRKVLGSFKSHLVRQFLMESILLSSVAFFISIWLVIMVLPFFNELSGKALQLPLSHYEFYLMVIGAALIIGFLAGVYPAFFLSSFKPINVLKGKLSLGSKSGLVRSGLVVFQFFISIVLLVGTAAVYRQLNYIQNKKLGFNKEQVLIINDAYMLDKQLQAFKNEILQIANVKSATLTGFIPVGDYNRSDQTFWEVGKDPSEENLVNMQFWRVDQDYLKTIGVELLHGRNFNRDIASDSNAVILNEKAFSAYNLVAGEQNQIQTFDFNPQTNNIIPGKFIKYNVIGVVKDFHFETLKQPIGNLGLTIGRNTNVMSIRLNTTDFSLAIDQMEHTWKKFASSIPFSYTFLDTAFEEMYRNEQRLARVSIIFAGLAIFIGCLGLFALASFMAEQRTKEIGIRKVMGASVKSIVLLLSGEFSKLIVISFILAVPCAWWGINQWLDEYSYKIDIGMEIYVLAGLTAYIIACLTVGYQSIRAAMNNPVDSLRSD